MYKLPVGAQPVVSLTYNFVCPAIGAGLITYRPVDLLVILVLKILTKPEALIAVLLDKPKSPALESKSLFFTASIFKSSKMF